jgi:hypothetical protein
MQPNSVQIVLATYNGARYLPAQLDSLMIQQAYFSEILVGDDGSTDETPGVIAKYATRFPGKIRTVAKTPGTKGAAANFASLLATSTAEYVLLCDQDDIWDADKIKSLTTRIKELEALHGVSKPLLVHSDLRVVDEQLHEISPSLFAYQNLDKHLSSLVGCLCQNSVTGCTVIVNRALVRIALPVPSQAIMHDWWLALAAAAFGRLEFVDRPFIQYRQHASNTLGAKGWGLRRIAQKVPDAFSRRRATDAIRPIIAQAEAFLAAYAATLSQQQKEVVQALGTMPQASPVSRLARAARLGLKKQGLLRTLGFYWFLLIADFSAPARVKL